MTFKTLIKLDNSSRSDNWLLLYNLPVSKNVHKIIDSESRYAFKFSESSSYSGNITIIDAYIVIPDNTEITLKFKYNS